MAEAVKIIQYVTLMLQSKEEDKLYSVFHTT